MDYEKYSQMFKALGHPIRLRMVEGLMQNECNVNQIVEKMQLPQSTISQHLGILKNSGILEPRKDGVKTCYCVVDSSIRRIIANIKEM